MISINRILSNLGFHSTVQTIKPGIQFENTVKKKIEFSNMNRFNLLCFGRRIQVY